MANYSTLKATIQQVIKANGNNEITGDLLQQSLLAMINSLGAGYQFVGGATPATNPGTPDYNVFYIATEDGTYTNFNNIVVSGEIAILYFNGSWAKTSYVLENSQYDELKEEIDNIKDGIDGILGKRTYSVTQGVALNTTSASNRLMVPLEAGKKYRFYVDYVEGGNITITLYFFYSSSQYITGAITNRNYKTFVFDVDYPNGIGIFIPAVSATSNGTVTVSVLEESISERVDNLEKDVSDLQDDKADANKRFGDNLYNPNDPNLIIGKYINSAGKFVDNSGYKISGPYKLDPGQSLTVNKFPSGTSLALYYDKYGKEYAGIFVAGDSVNPKSVTNNNTIVPLYAYCSLGSTQANIMINYGSTSLDYQPYINGTVVYTETPDYKKSIQKINDWSDTEYIHAPYNITQGTAINTTSNFLRFFVNMPANRKLTVKLNYSTGTPGDNYDVYFYRGNSYVSYPIINNVDKVFEFEDDYDSIGFYIPASKAIADGTATISVLVQGVIDQHTEIIDVLGGKNIIRFSDVLYHWLNGEKFPIGFQGDSTTDGVSTTGWTVDNSHPAQDTAAGGRGKADYICELAYPKQLENLLRSELGNNILRVYNIGYYGASLANNFNQLDAIYSDVYSDVKMVGIVLGINDRGTATDPADYYNDVLTLLIKYVDYFLGKGITPFMVTNQVVTQCGNDPNTSSYSALYQDYIQTLCNKAKQFVAKKYNLEIIDMNEFGRLILECSAYPYDQITEDLHFKDLGHKLEAGFLFTQLIPWVNKTDDAEKLYFGFNCAKCKTGLRIGLLENTTNDRFKIEVNTTKGDTNNALIFDAYMFNNSKNGAYNVTYQTPVASGYIVIDGDTANPIQITSTSQNIGTWDIGLHHVQVFTGASTTVAFKGFLLESLI